MVYLLFLMLLGNKTKHKTLISEKMIALPGSDLLIADYIIETFVRYSTQNRLTFESNEVIMKAKYFAKQAWLFKEDI